MITILMPIYNGIEFINESVVSIIIQNYNEWELLIGINGHPPNSNVYQIAKKYELTNNKIKVFDFPQFKSKPKTLNELVKYAKYDYVALLDVDDIWYLNKLYIQSKFLNKYDVIGSRCVWIGDYAGTIPELPIGDISNFDFLSTNPIINSSCIIKKSLAHWNDSFIEDYELWLKLWNQGKKFYNCKEILVKHRIHKDSFFNNNHTDQMVNELKAKYKK